MRVLVTGGLGFVGHAVTRRLAEAGHSPVVLTSRPDGRSRVVDVPVVRADLRDRAGMRRVVEQVRPEGVCHLAALTRVRDSFEAPLDYFDVNVGGTLSLLASLAGLAPVPVVFASSGAVYGFCEGNIREDQPTRPANPYGASKLAAEEALRYHAGTGAIGVLTLRCFNIAGAVDGVGDGDTTRIIPKAVAVAADRAGVLGINGDGKAVREFTHVADVADAVVLGLAAARPGTAATYNIGSGIEVTMLDVVRTIESVTGRRLPVEHHPPKPEPAVLVADSDRIRRDLEWDPRRSSLEQIIRDAWAAAGC
ncbi:MAG TPA: NAD-dependent epimerase/dehydratase family protein [Acidimicrobiales bacterium]|jgi:UDP-glucose 4-epimerase